MDYTFEPVDGGGYVARFDGVLDGASVGEFWTHVLAVRPDGGFPTRLVIPAGNFMSGFSLEWDTWLSRTSSTT